MLSAAARLEAELGVEPKKANGTRPSNGDGLFDLANGVDTIALLDRLGIEHDDKYAVCPGCGEDGALICKDGGIKCLHDRCGHVGPASTPGFRTPVDLIVERERVEPVEAAKKLCEMFGIEVPKNGASVKAVPEDSNPKPQPEWSEPIPLSDASDLPPFPLEALPPALRDWVEAEAEATQTPPDLAAMLALATVATAAAGKYVIAPKPGWVEPVNIFTAVALGPGERKSQVFRDATRPLGNFERDEAERLAPSIRARLTEREILEKRVKKAVDKAAKLNATEEDRDLAIDLREKLHKLKVPTVPRLVADDVTPERLAVLLEENGERLAVMSAEGGLFDTMAGRYSEGVGNLDVFLKGHSGDPLRVDRIGRPPVILNSPCLTMGIAFQPEVLAGLGAKPGFRGRGLLARFAFVLPESRIGSRRVDAPPVPDHVRDAYHAAIGRLLREAPEEPTILRFTPEAQELFEDFAWAIEPRLGPDGDLHVIGDWANKMVGLAARLAALLTVVNSGDTGNCGTGVLGNSVSIVSYLSIHSKGALEAMGATQKIADAQHLARWIRRNAEGDTFERRTAQQATKAIIKGGDRLDAALRILVAHGHVRELPRERGPGRRARRFSVNPLSQYSQYPQYSKSKAVQS